MRIILPSQKEEKKTGPNDSLTRKKSKKCANW